MDFAHAVPLPGTPLSLLHLAPLSPGLSFHITSSRNSPIRITKSGLCASPCIPKAHCDSAMTVPCTLGYLLLTGYLFVCRPPWIHTHTLAMPVSLVLSTVFDMWWELGEDLLRKEEKKGAREKGRKGGGKG